MCGVFSIDKSEVYLGTMQSQKIELVNTLTNVTISDQFNKARWTNTNGSIDSSSTRKICDLQPTITYAPEIIIESEIALDPIGNVQL